MKNCAVICEYNPFHTGHLYQLQRIATNGADNIFCVMSGAFVQSAMPAFCDKAIRAECAVLGGADAVIELPAVFATSSAQGFAEGAVKIIGGIHGISHLAMGAVGPESDILRLAEIKATHIDEFSKMLKIALDGGKSYNAANVAALSALYGKLYPDKCPIDGLLSDPNNILCIEYICALARLCPAVEPMIIQRRGAKHNDDIASDGFVSATAVRNADACGNLGGMRGYIPYNYEKMSLFRAEHAPSMDAYKKMAVFAVKKARAIDIAELRDCSEGMEHLIKNLSAYSDFDTYVDAIVGKRYGKKRVYRLFLDALLGIRKDDIRKNFCTRLLACKKSFDFSLLPSTVKTNNAELKSAAQADTQIKDILEIDNNAVALYNTLCGIDGNYFNYSLVKV